MSLRLTTEFCHTDDGTRSTVYHLTGITPDELMVLRAALHLYADTVDRAAGGFPAAAVLTDLVDIARRLLAKLPV